MYRLGPGAIADARSEAAGATAALLGRGLGDGHGDESGHAAIGVEARYPHQAAVDHHSNAGDGQAGFGDGRRQDHLAAARPGQQCRVLGVLGQVAVKGRDQDVQPAVLQLRLDAADLSLARQEDQQIALRLLGQGTDDQGGHGVLEALAKRLVEPPNGDRVETSVAGDDRCVSHQAGHRFAVERRRHDEQAQVLAERRLGLKAQGQAEIGIETAFVELVEQHGTDALQSGIILDHAGEDALGDHFYPGVGSCLAVQPDAVADRGADRFTERLGHAPGGGTGRQAARLENNDLATPQPRLTEQGERHARRLAGAGRGLEHGIGTIGEGGEQGRQNRLDGKGHGAA